MGAIKSLLQKMPFSPAMCYLPVGYALGPGGFGLVDLRIERDATLLTWLTEAALLISLFSVGLRLRIPLRDPIWRLPLRLAGLAMLPTIAMLAVIGFFWLGLPLGAAILLGAILAPTDPILASDVQIQDVGDRDRIRFGLSAEGGLNDGTAYPFIMLGLALVGAPDAAAYRHPAVLLQVAWGISAGLVAGWCLGWLTTHAVVRLRSRHKLAIGMEEFLTIGLIAFSYGVAHLIHAIGFLAVFATGVAVRHIEFAASGKRAANSVIGPVTLDSRETVASDPEKAPAYMAESVLGFNEHLENIAEFVMVILLGVILSDAGFSIFGVLLAVILFVVVRPLSVGLSLIGSPVTPAQRRLIAWVGIRGIGSLYYLVFAAQHGRILRLRPDFLSIILTVVALSIVVHGISATPLMKRYYTVRGRAR
ncbi:MAG: cation:proton antiporter [Burkholderiaceae bacterium]